MCGSHSLFGSKAHPPNVRLGWRCLLQKLSLEKGKLRPPAPLPKKVLCNRCLPTLAIEWHTFVDVLIRKTQYSKCVLVMGRTYKEFCACNLIS